MTVSYGFSALLVLLISFLGVGSLMNLSSYPHWFVRGWDFPRVQIILIAWLLLVLDAIAHMAYGANQVVAGWPMWAIAVLLTAWHGFRIIPYTPVFPNQAVSTPANLVADHGECDRTVRMVMSNVEMENGRYAAWMKEMRSVDPDILLVVEVDEKWMNEIDSFCDSFDYRVAEPRSNWYGMLLLSKLEIVDHAVRYLIQKDVPSIDAQIKMGDGTTIRFIGVHPRPPEPIRGNDATARDAELTLWGNELEEESGPVIIGGDLNDVAWSPTTRLFLRTSGLLDPRRGRGFYNSFHADHWYMRFPLDHIFHSPHFTISCIRRLGHVGSDHFPIMIDLRYTPEYTDGHNVLENKESDEAEIELRLQRAVDAQSLEGESIDEGHHEPIAEVDETD